MRAELVVHVHTGEPDNGYVDLRLTPETREDHAALDALMRYGTARPIEMSRGGDLRVTMKLGARP